MEGAPVPVAETSSGTKHTCFILFPSLWSLFPPFFTFTKISYPKILKELSLKKYPGNSSWCQLSFCYKNDTLQAQNFLVFPSPQLRTEWKEPSHRGDWPAQSPGSGGLDKTQISQITGKKKTEREVIGVQGAGSSQIKSWAAEARQHNNN